LKHKLFLLFLVISFLCCNKSKEGIKLPDPPVKDTVISSFPHPDHIIFVWFENKNYSSIVGSSDAPYINSLIAKGTLFTNTFAITHPSYPNYVHFFSGEANGVTTNTCIDTTALTTPNLYTSLDSAGKSFAWYSEGLPETGSTVCKSGSYVERHNPTTIFANVPATANKPFKDFPTDYSHLENVVCISPNVKNDMHDESVAVGDAWLKTNLSSLIDWCETHNSIFVVYFDENDGASGNRIPVVAVGQNVKVNYQQTSLYDHYNWTRTICSMFSAPETWTTNLSSRSRIDSCWK